MVRFMFELFWCCYLGYSGFAVILKLKDALLKWSLCRLAVQHHTLMCHLPMLVSMQYIRCWTVVQNSRCCPMDVGLILSAAFCRYIVSCHLYHRWGNAWYVQPHLIIDFKLITPFSFQLLRLPPFLRLDPPVNLRRRCCNSRPINCVVSSITSAYLGSLLFCGPVSLTNH
jgi:hypothetical protein